VWKIRVFVWQVNVEMGRLFLVQPEVLSSAGFFESFGDMEMGVQIRAMPLAF
jgi:hypothetical protein